MALFGINVGSSISYLASKRINDNVQQPVSWSGTLADLQQQILVDSNTCGSWGHTQNWTHDTTNIRAQCNSDLNNLYAPIIQQLQAKEAAQDAQVQGIALQGNSQLYAIVAIILIVIIIISIYLK